MSTEPGARLPDLGPRGAGWVGLQFVGLFAVLTSARWGTRLDDGQRAVAVICGALMMAIGLLLLRNAFRALGDSLTALPAPKTSAALVTRGPYAAARHPIYGALILGCFGWAVVWASLPGILAALATTLVLFLKSLKEEAWLVGRYPDYAKYRERTWRFFPFRGQR